MNSASSATSCWSHDDVGGRTGAPFCRRANSWRELSGPVPSRPPAPGVRMSETITPTTHSVDETGGGSVIDPENAHDGDESTAARIVATISLTYASETVNGFGADAEPGNRGSVTLRVRLAGVAWTTPDDRAFILFRPSVGSDWTTVKGYTIVDVPETRTWVEFDITAPSGVFVSTGFQVAVQFAKDTGGQPPVPTDP